MRITWKQRLRYQFDNTMSKGTPAMIAWLGLATLVIISVAALLVAFLGIAPEGTESLSLPEALWTSLMHSMDAGTVAGDSGWSFRALMFIVTLGGIFIFSTLIGALANGIQGALEQLRKGRSLVCEQDHTVILGYNSKLATLVGEISIANQNRKNAVIAVLAPRDKVELEDELRSQIEDLNGTRLVVRSGDPSVLDDLALVNPNQARSLVVLSPEDRCENDADAWTIKTLLAIVNNPERRELPYHIVAEIRHPRNLDVARIVAKHEAELVLTDDFVSRVMVQTSRQSGLSVVYQELLDFAGVEIYFAPAAALAGRPFRDALGAFARSTVMGVQFADGRVKLNPSHDTLLSTGDKLVVISEDDDTLELAKDQGPDVRVDLIRPVESVARAPESTLMLGWNRKSPSLLVELDHYMVPGSTVTVVASDEGVDEVLKEVGALLKHTHIHFVSADPAHRQVLESVDVGLFDHILVLAESDTLEREQADSRVLMVLLQLRHIQEMRGLDLDIVSEMMSGQNRDLAEATRADDFIVSDKLVGLLIGQVAENKALMQVFDDLFKSDGSEIYLKPVGDYIKLGATVNFATLAAAAEKRGEIALGYRCAQLSHDSSASYGVILNPARTQEIEFFDEDCVIVLAEQ